MSRYHLTLRERRKIAQLLALGYSTRDIAQRFGIARDYVRRAGK